MSTSPPSVAFAFGHSPTAIPAGHVDPNMLKNDTADDNTRWAFRRAMSWAPLRDLGSGKTMWQTMTARLRQHATDMAQTVGSGGFFNPSPPARMLA